MPGMHCGSSVIHRQSHVKSHVTLMLERIESQEQAMVHAPVADELRHAASGSFVDKSMQPPAHARHAENKAMVKSLPTIT